MAKIRFIPANASRAEWFEHNPVPLAGEICIEKDSGFWKFGDGEKAYKDLPYAMSPRVEILNGHWIVDGVDTGVPVKGESLIEGLRKEGKSFLTYLDIYNEIYSKIEGLYAEDLDENLSTIQRAVDSVQSTDEKANVAIALMDSGNDLVVNGGKLYRSSVDLIEGKPHLVHNQCGIYMMNDHTSITLPNKKKVVLRFKAKSDTEGHILAYTADDKHKLIIPMYESTHLYSHTFEFANVDSRELRFLGFTLYNSGVKIWDFEVRGE